MSESNQHIYLAESKNAVKIGRSKKPEKRISSLSTGNPNEIELLTSIDVSELPLEESAAKFERFLHKQCEPWHRSGEWFDKEAIGYYIGFLHGVGADVKNIEWLE